MSSRIDEEMEKAVREGIFPAGALLVASKNEILYRKFFGQATEATLFDIASLTKPVATASLALFSLQDKNISLSEAVSKQLKEFDAEDKKKITLRHLLKHTSGLPAWKPYFEEIAREHPEAAASRKSEPYYLGKISQEPLETPIGFQRLYSDLGFILLGIYLEEIWGMPLDELFAEKIASPFGLKNTFYVRNGSAPRPLSFFAPTGESTFRKKRIVGEVHDDNAYMLGGVAGHAGLFSNVDDLHRFVLGYQESFKKRPKESKLGWDSPSPENSQAGNEFSKNSIGHLGFTGCSLWMDLEKEFHVILLTNRVHPSSKNEEIKKSRPLIHDIVYEELIRK